MINMLHYFRKVKYLGLNFKELVVEENSEVKFLF